ncbi:hypothetical protein GT347_18295 [Xylophilus rhododendri]|uniref:Uncharacterized protein n=1 Tax=Xylophilus rhododendri TaxID=2697032 RepID=A0A857J7D0_9BURK|nr:hypothetical protein [Xylophilus rhododendri]QHI99756.1 hypothetical protein GT347_18295 [Xylophilus rhododendri]
MLPTLGTSGPPAAQASRPLSCDEERLLCVLRESRHHPQHPALRALTDDELRDARQWLPGLPGLPDEDELLAVVARELNARREPWECRGNAVLRSLPARPPRPARRVELPAGMVDPHALPEVQQVNAFIVAALHRERDRITVEIADEIRFFEDLARKLAEARLDLRELPALLAQAPAADPPSIGILYLSMSFKAACACLSHRLSAWVRGHVGWRDYEDFLAEAPVLRMIEGREALGHDPVERHTLRFLLTERLERIRALPGASRLAPQETALRVAYSLKTPAFLLDARLPWSEAAESA